MFDLLFNYVISWYSNSWIEATTFLSTPRTSAISQPPRGTFPMSRPSEEERCAGEGYGVEKDDVGRM